MMKNYIQRFILVYFALGVFGSTANSQSVSPTTPANLVAHVASISQINLTWTASTSPSGISKYTIYRNGSQAGTSTGASYSDTGLTAATLYTYTVIAIDVAGNNSSQSSPVAARTQSPTISPDGTVLNGGTSGYLESSSGIWTYGAASGSAYVILLNGTQAGGGTSNLLLIYNKGTIYTQGGGNWSVWNAGLSEWTRISGDPRTPPTTPTNLIARSASPSQINLSWTASTSVLGLSKYIIFRNGAQVATSAGASYSDMGLAAVTSYTYTVMASDVTGKNSALSSTVTAMTQSPTISPDGSVLNGGTTNGYLETSLGIWTFGAASGSGYPIMLNGATLANSVSNMLLVYNKGQIFTEGGGNWSSWNGSGWQRLTGDPRTAPTVPANLVARTSSPSQVNLTWTASTSVLGVAQYLIYRNGKQVATSTSGSYSDTGLTAVTSYTYTVLASDVTGNNSAQSSAVTVMTQSPTISADGSVLNGGTAGYLETSLGIWTFGAASGSNYVILLNGGPVAKGTSNILLVYNKGQLYAGSWSTWNGSGWVHISGDPRTPPSVPANFTANVTSTSQVNFTWAASTSVLGIASYAIYRNGVKVGTSTGTTYSDSGLTAVTSYTYTILATDIAGKSSAQSSPLNVVTQSTIISPNGSVLKGGTAGYLETSLGIWTFGAASGANYAILLNGAPAANSYAAMLLVYNSGKVYATSATGWAYWNGTGWTSISGDPRTPPTAPGITSTVVVSPSQINLTWSASGSLVGVAKYMISRNGVQVGTSTSTSYSDTGLSAGTLYTYTAVASDVTGNNSLPSSAVSIRTQSIAISAEGTTINAGLAGYLETSLGIWTFGVAQGPNYMIVLNGIPRACYAQLLIVSGSGQVFAQTSLGTWLVWNGSVFVVTSPPTETFLAGGPKLELSRKYCSLSNFSGMFGYGWRTDYDQNLTTDSYGDVVIYDKEGTAIYFMYTGAYYIPSPGNYSALVKNSDNTYTLFDKYDNVTHYDINGRLLTRIDRNGNTLSFIYNPTVSGGSYIQDAGGHRINLSFDSNNHVISAQDPAGNTYQYGYDTNGNLVSVKDPTGAVSNYSYDSNHHIVQFTNSNGHNSYFQYDSLGRAVMNWRDLNVNKVTLNYEAGNTTVVTDSLGHNDTYVFNSIGLLTSHTDPLGNVTQKAWDANMDLTSITDARKNVTSFAYDASGNLIQITDPLGKQTNLAYSSTFNLVSAITDPLGNITNFAYDGSGNLATITDALGKTHTYQYDQYGNLIIATDSLGNNTNYTHGDYGLFIQKTDALGNSTSFTYDTDGDLLSQTDPFYNTSSFQYDNLGRVLKITFADNSGISYAYDLFGNLTGMTDQRGNVWAQTFDAYERLAQFKDPKGDTTGFSYDTNGNLLMLKDANGHNTTYTYDSDNRVLKQTNALGYATSVTYDPVGNAATRVDANGNSTSYTYDALNRLTKMAYPGGTSVVYAYDALSRETSMTDSTGVTSYTYDALGRLLSQMSPGASSTISYTYDSEGNQLTSIDQSGRTISNTYDALNRLSTVTDPNGKTTYTYDANSNELSATSPNGATESYAYDALNRALSAVNVAGAGVISSYANTYDIEGMITKKNYSDGSWLAYTYDALNQLLSETKETSSALAYKNAYTYDPVGNRLSWTKNTTLGEFWSVDSLNMPAQVLTNMTSAGYGAAASPGTAVSLARSYSYDAGNRLTGWNYGVGVGTSSFPVQTDAYTYDKNGNRLTKSAALTGVAAAQQTSYAYDFENRLDQLTYVNIPGITGTQIDKLAYNGDGLRMQSVLNTTGVGASPVTAKYLYDGTNILVERNAAGATTKTYTRGLDFGGGINSLIAQNTTSPAGVVYYQYNDLGSTVNLTNASGATSATYNYDAYGNLLTTSAAGDTNRYLFSTKEFDARSGLYYFGARYYDPEVGRWLTADPLGFVDGTNVYAYVNNNPLNLVDPYGFQLERLMYGANFDPKRAESHYGLDIPDLPINLPLFEDPLFVLFTGIEDAAANVARTEAEDLAEQIVLEDAKAGGGEEIMQDTDFGDPEYSGGDWQKWQAVQYRSDGRPVVVHYWKNIRTGQQQGYKFKNPT